MACLRLGLRNRITRLHVLDERVVELGRQACHNMRWPGIRGAPRGRSWYKPWALRAIEPRANILLQQGAKARQVLIGAVIDSLLLLHALAKGLHFLPLRNLRLQI